MTYNELEEIQMTYNELQRQELCNTDKIYEMVTDFGCVKQCKIT